MIYMGPLGRHSHQLIEYFEVSSIHIINLKKIKIKFHSYNTLFWISKCLYFSSNL